MPALIPPTYEDAALVLRLYELRREEKLRAAREWFRAKFFPQTFEELKAVMLGTGVENTHYRMATSYWEMAASFVAQGVLHPELFFDSSGEALFVWAKLAPFVAQIRAEYQSPRLLANLERAVGMVPWATARIPVIQKRLAGMREKLIQETKSAG
jgi:hypothetical protein